MESIVACDFFTKTVLTARGPLTAYPSLFRDGTASCQAFEARERHCLGYGNDHDLDTCGLPEAGCRFRVTRDNGLPSSYSLPAHQEARSHISSPLGRGRSQACAASTRIVRNGSLFRILCKRSLRITGSSA